MATRKKKLPPIERLTWALEYVNNGNKITDPYPTLTKQYLINQDRDYLLDRQHSVTLRGNEIEICFFLKTFWTIDELITALQVFQASCNTERYLYIETYQEPYDDGYSARAFFKGWRPMTADELKEANELRKVTKTEQQAAMELYRQREIERARSLLKEIGEL